MLLYPSINEIRKKRTADTHWLYWLQREQETSLTANLCWLKMEM